jgi:hypothetical protein
MFYVNFDLFRFPEKLMLGVNYLEAFAIRGSFYTVLRNFPQQQKLKLVFSLASVEVESVVIGIACGR